MKKSQEFKVLLDGEEVKHLVSASVPEGFVIVEEKIGGDEWDCEYKHNKLYGKVEFIDV